MIVRSIDVPQAPDLFTIRAVVDAIGEGRTSATHVASCTRYSGRHARYRVHAARSLGFVRGEEGSFELTDLGARLVRSEPDSEAERELFREAIDTSAVIRAVAPGLLHGPEPSRESVAERIVEVVGLARTTAEMRARTLISWRRHVSEVEQLSLGF